MTVLNAHLIKQALAKTTFPFPLNVDVFSVIDSTNNYLKTLPYQNSIDLCLAEAQTAGRGRFGREWYSPAGENIYCSIRWPIMGAKAPLASLSLVVSLTLVTALKQMNIANLQVKWPNDLIWQDKKLGGVLVEMGSQQQSIIIGIGLNVNSITAEHSAPNKPWCSLYDITGHFIDRNTLIAQCLSTLNEPIQRLMTNGFHGFTSDWNAVDYLYNREVTVAQAAATYTGIARGVNEAGQLLLLDKAGISHVLSSGEASLQ